MTANNESDSDDSIILALDNFVPVVSTPSTLVHLKLILLQMIISISLL